METVQKPEHIALIDSAAWDRSAAPLAEKIEAAVDNHILNVLGDLMYEFEK